VRYLFLFVIISCLNYKVNAEDSIVGPEIVMSIPEDSIRTIHMPQIEVLGHKNLFKDLPGSVEVIAKIELQRINATNGNEVFRRIAGIHVTEEEGAGMRANISIRGLDPDRSRNIQMLEDGIPLQLNPYGEPEMYYTPPIERMSSVEVMKGSGQIMFGPQTIGGVINYLTPDPPASSEGRVNIRTGQYGYFSTLVGYGNSFGKSGFIINYLHKQAKDLGVSSFRVDDVTGKFKVALSEKSILGLKFQLYNEISNSTYVGITQPMYDNGEYYPVLAPDDELKVRRYALSLSHKHFFNSKMQLSTTAYYYTITRNWRRQDFSSSKTAANQTGVIWGDTTIANGALYMLGGGRLRNRSFDVMGIESRYTQEYSLGSRAKGELAAGFRLLGEKAKDTELNITKTNSWSGTMRADEQRPGLAASGFFHNKFDILNKVNITAGVRFEQYWYQREILFASGKDTLIRAEEKQFAFIPGAGINYNPVDKLTLFTGVHRGYAPPVIKTAISNAGEAYDLGPQMSWNYEFGLRSEPTPGVSLETTMFLMDFSKQIIPVSESSGAAGTGLINAGQSRHIGVEAGVVADIGKMFKKNYSLYLGANFTFVDATFSKDRFQASGSDTFNIKGNYLPYAPKFLGNITAGYHAPFGLDIMISGNFIGDQFTDLLNTEIASANGRTGLIDQYYTLDASASYRITKINSAVNFAVKNLTNNRYIASRRPQGIKVGTPVFFTAGVDVRF
jgi:Fe(3+) dicitrate transport protein